MVRGADSIQFGKTAVKEDAQLGVTDLAKEESMATGRVDVMGGVRAVTRQQVRVQGRDDAALRGEQLARHQVLDCRTRWTWKDTVTCIDLQGVEGTCVDSEGVAQPRKCYTEACGHVDKRIGLTAAH